jgi:RimJ/RimL family protein N-acetyltransferase
MARLVHIRPSTEAELSFLEMLHADPDEASQYGFFGYQNPGDSRREFAERGFISDNHGRLAVTAGDEGEVVGEVSWRKVQTGPSSHSWHIGIGLLARAGGMGTAPGRSGCWRNTCSRTPSNRIAAETDIDNLAEQRSLEKAGFTREGTLRGSCFRAGKWRDMASYSIVRADVDPG